MLLYFIEIQSYDVDLKVNITCTYSYSEIKTYSVFKALLLKCDPVIKCIYIIHAVFNKAVCAPTHKQNGLEDKMGVRIFVQRIDKMPTSSCGTAPLWVTKGVRTR